MMEPVTVYFHQLALLSVTTLFFSFVSVDTLLNCLPYYSVGLVAIATVEHKAEVKLIFIRMHLT